MGDEAVVYDNNNSMGKGGGNEQNENNLSIFDMEEPNWLEKQKQARLLQTVKAHELSNTLSMRKQKEYLVKPGNGES